MEIRVLRYFLAVAREQNITKAAGILNVSQPTLSTQMKELEKVLAAPAAETDIDRLTREYLELKRTLDRTMEEWMELNG